MFYAVFRRDSLSLCTSDQQNGLDKVDLAGHSGKTSLSSVPVNQCAQSAEQFWFLMHRDRLKMGPYSDPDLFLAISRSQ